MSNDNKEGAGVPVAVVGKGNGGGVGITYLPALYSLPHGTKLYATPPAVMPAAPSDAECRKAWAKHAAKQHSWLNNSFPPMRDGRFDCGQHESEYQTFLAGVRYGRS